MSPGAGRDPPAANDNNDNKDNNDNNDNDGHGDTSRHHSQRAQGSHTPCGAGPPSL